MVFENRKYRQEDIENIKYPKGSQVLIVDADTVAFRIASASDKKSIIVTSPSGRKKNFKSRTAFKKWAESNNLAFSTDGYKIEDHIETEPVSYCLNTLKKKIDAMKSKCNADYMEIYFGGKDNFRLELPLIEKYKGQRPEEKPTHLKDCQQFLVKKYNCREIVGVETDDVVQQRLVEVIKQGNQATLATIDKDAYQVFDEIDYCILDIRENDIVKVKGGFGKVYMNDAVNPTLKGDGFIWLMSQVFLMDGADNYKMNSHYLKRYGFKTFYKDFSLLKTHKQVLELMKSLWLKLLPNCIEYVDWTGKLRQYSRMKLAELYFQCAYMRLTANDPLTLEDFFIKYGVSTEELK